MTFDPAATRWNGALSLVNKVRTRYVCQDLKTGLLVVCVRGSNGVAISELLYFLQRKSSFIMDPSEEVGCKLFLFIDKHVCNMR